MQHLDVALDAWSRRKWLALLAFAAVAGVTVAVAQALPNLYRSTATVLIERQQVSEAFVRPSVTAELDTRLQTIREDVMSRTRLADLIARLNLYSDSRPTVPMEALVARMRREIELDIKGVESQMSGRMATISFTISFSGRDPATVARVANELAAMYVQANTTLREGQAVRTADFLKAQLADARRELDAQDRRASEFRLSHIGELPQQVDTNLASIERLNTQLRLNGENQIRLMDRRERLEKERATAGAAVAPSPSPDDERVTRLQQQLDDLGRKYTNDYPDVIRLRGELDRAQQAARRSAAARPSTPALDSGRQVDDALGDVDAELRALKTEERSLRDTIAAYEQRVENVPKRQQEFQEVSRDYTTVKERYETLLKRYEEAQLAESLEQGRQVEQFRILDPALPPRDPVAPNRVRLLGLGLLLALGLAVGAVIAAEKLDTSFHAIDELRAFSAVPALAVVPLLASSARARARRRFALAAVSAIVGLSLAVAGARYVAHGNEQLVRLMERSRG
jgi:polysaccharide chain length determinant protein (PEP-CTERM system associated)